MLDEEHPHLQAQPGDSNSYTVGELHGHNVVLACLPGQQGKGAAAIAATNLSRSFPCIKWRLLVGTGGGVPSGHHDVRLGDVVVSMPAGRHPGVVQYDLGKATTSGFDMKGFLWPLPALLRNAAQDMHSNHLGRDNMIGEYMEAMFEKWPGLTSYRQPEEPDTLFPADYLHPPDAATCAGHCEPSRAVARPARQIRGPEIHYGLIASGDTVMKDAIKRDTIARSIGHDVLCFEMEAAGLMTEYPAIVIRGISTYADSHKNDDWQRYAAATAAACAKELLLNVDPEPAAANTSKYNAPLSIVFTGPSLQNTARRNVERELDLAA